MANGTGQSSIEIYARIIRDVGFPIAVSGVLLWFLLTRLDPALSELRDTLRTTMNEFTSQLRKQTDAFERSNSLSDENNERLRQLMGDAPWRRDRRETTRESP